MKKAIFLIILAAALNCRGNEIKVIDISPNGDVTINATATEAKPRGFWPFLEAVRFDIFKDVNGVERYIARIVITQTYPTYSVGIIMARLDGSGTRPSPDEISKGMICRRTNNETLHAERKAYKTQKKALKRHYKLMKLKAKSGVFESLDRTVQDSNAIKSIEHKEQTGEWQSESIKVEKK